MNNKQKIPSRLNALSRSPAKNAKRKEKAQPVPSEIPNVSALYPRTVLKPIKRKDRPIDECLRRHIHGVLNPFQTDSWNPTHETDSMIPSRKVRVYARGNFLTGTDTVGFVAAGPDASDNSVAGGGGILFSSGGLAYGDFTNGSNAQTNSPYTPGSFGTGGNACRVNVCQLRVRNITPMLNRGGTLYSLRTPDESSVTGLSTANAVQNLDPTGLSVRKDTSGQGWQTVTWIPRDRQQCEYNQTRQPVSVVNVAGGRSIGFLAFSPGAAFIQTYEWEYISWVEIIASQNTTAYLVHGATVNEPHPDTLRVHQVVYHLKNKPEVSEAPPSNALTNFIHGAVMDGEKAVDIIARGTDLATRILDGAPKVYATASRVIGMLG